MSDHVILNYMRFKQTNCNLKITGNQYAKTGYSLGLNKNMKQEEKVYEHFIF